MQSTEAVKKQKSLKLYFVTSVTFSLFWSLIQNHRNRYKVIS
ncbi:MAG: hypothetical protein ACI93P_001897 [bacterium]|jgi:hypothetical protein